MNSSPALGSVAPPWGIPPKPWPTTAVKTKGHFPSEDAARKLLYLAIQNAMPAWTRTRNWTTALLAFKIHFGDRLPD